MFIPVNRGIPNLPLSEMGKEQEGLHFVECQVCKKRFPNSIIRHILKDHGMTVPMYQSQYPQSPVVISHDPDSYKKELKTFSDPLLNSERFRAFLNGFLFPPSLFEKEKEEFIESVEYKEFTPFIEALQSLGFTLDIRGSQLYLMKDKYLVMIETPHTIEAADEAKEEMLRTVGYVKMTVTPYEIKEKLEETVQRIKARIQRKPKIYCAGPYFVDQDKKSMDALEQLLKGRFKDQFDCYFPFQDGFVLDRNNANSPLIIFQENTYQISDCDMIVALVDNRDVGTCLEIGYARAKNVPIITWSNSDFGSNLMIAETAIAHATSINQLENILKEFHDFHEDIFALYHYSSSEDILEYNRSIRGNWLISAGKQESIE